MLRLPEMALPEHGEHPSDRVGMRPPAHPAAEAAVVHASNYAHSRLGHHFRCPTQMVLQPPAKTSPTALFVRSIV